ncbi:MAG: hypothetical protein D6800_07760, partial [Candidatus Zixiibacteriota bacterium]
MKPGRAGHTLGKLASAISIAFLLSACAQIGTPPGGPIDKQGPYIIGSEPPDGAVNVTAGHQIILYFSETVVKPRTGQPVFISPHPAHKPDLSWKGSKLVITLAEPFAANRTYVVTVNTTVTDLRNNPMDSNTTIAFATGPSLDTGSVAGLVANNNQPVTGALAALYEGITDPDSVTFDSLVPEYLAATGRDGRFDLRNLPPKQFFLLAFVDKNRDQLFNPATEQFALPDRPVRVDGPLALDDLYLPITRWDTSSISIISASETADRLVRVRFNRSLPTADLARPGAAKLVSLSDTTVVFPSNGIAEWYL